jgi:hypothetical protein
MEAPADMSEDERIARLAKQIDSEIKKDHHLLLGETDILKLHREGAVALYAICADFVASINNVLSAPAVELVPANYTASLFRDSGLNLFQINTQGRIVQVAFQPTREKFSTEKFRIPYILEGEVRAYNQQMLERTQIHSRALFYCLQEQGNTWHYYEWLQGRTGTFGRSELVNLFERLI